LVQKLHNNTMTKALVQY